MTMDMGFLSSLLHEQPLGYVADDDCDEMTHLSRANGYCDTVDSDCDGDVAEDDSLDAVIWYADVDEDNFGDALSFVACDQPTSYVSDDTDCNDASADVFPGAGL